MAGLPQRITARKERKEDNVIGITVPTVHDALSVYTADHVIGSGTAKEDHKISIQQAVTLQTEQYSQTINEAKQGVSSETTSKSEIPAGTKEKGNGDTARTLTLRSHESGNGEAMTEDEDTNSESGTNIAKHVRALENVKGNESNMGKYIFNKSRVRQKKIRLRKRK